MTRTYRRICAALISATAMCALQAGLAGQTLQAPTVGGMSATQVGVEPAMKLPTARYLADADALDTWVVAACRLVTGRTRDARLLAFAAQAGPAHWHAMRLRGGSPTSRPDLAERLGKLRGARGDDFDRLFVADQIAVQRRLWSLHAGYAVDGTDPRLKRAAAADVSMEERELHDLPMRPMRY